MRLKINEISVALGFFAALQPANGEKVLEYIENTKEGTKEFSLKPKYRDISEVNLEQIFSSGAYGLQKKDKYAKMKTVKSSKKKSRQSKRNSDYDSTDLDFESILYSLPLEIGSNKQKVTVQVDTGSSDLWVTTQDWDSNCEEARFKCTTSGFFDPSKSSSFVNNHTLFNISYLGGYGVQGHYGFDTVIIGDDIELSDFPFAIGEESTAEMAGIIGIGLPHGEACYVSDNVTYENFAFQLVKSGITESATYSIALAAIDNNSDGDFLLGAIDHSKYSGDFLRFPIPPSGDDLTILPYVAATFKELYVGAAASLDDDNNVDTIVKAPIYSGSVPVVFDTGSSYINFPQSFIDGIAYQFGFTYDSSSSQYYTSCSDISTDYFVGINVQGLDLTVPLYYLLETAEQDNGDEVCVLMVEPADVVLLGDNFLRGVYMVVDLQNNEIALGNANLNPNSTSSDDDIEVISDTIPASTNKLYSSTEISSGTLYPTSESLSTYSTGFPTYYSDLYAMASGENSGDASDGGELTYASEDGGFTYDGGYTYASGDDGFTYATDDGFTNATDDNRFTHASESENGNSKTSPTATSQTAMTTEKSSSSESTNGNGATTATRDGATSASSSSHSSSNAGSSVSIKYSALILILANLLI
ncbi:hypothetical protein B5S31_g922 [[Candida] boidinii]|nr:hypothetical protein B5S31_g922 [[Candida] boidinii]